MKPEIHTVEFVKSVVDLGDLPDTPLPEITFVGRSNVGKSSLINLLTRRKNVARTSGQPGKTQALNFFLVNERLHLVDCPGFGFAKSGKKMREEWEKLVAGYLIYRDRLEIVFHLVDSRHPPGPIDNSIFDLSREFEATHVVVLTKTDKLKANERRSVVSRMEKHLAKRGLERMVIPTSSLKRDGREQLLFTISDLIPGTLK